MYPNCKWEIWTLQKDAVVSSVLIPTKVSGPFEGHLQDVKLKPQGTINTTDAQNSAPITFRLHIKEIPYSRLDNNINTFLNEIEEDLHPGSFIVVTHRRNKRLKIWKALDKNEQYTLHRVIDSDLTGSFKELLLKEKG